MSIDLLPSPEQVTFDALEIRQRIPARKLAAVTKRAAELMTLDRRDVVPKGWDGWRGDEDPADKADAEATAAMVQREIRHLTAVLLWRHESEALVEHAVAMWTSGNLLRHEVLGILFHPVDAEQHDLFTLVAVIRRLAAGESHATIEAEGYSHHLVTTMARFGYHQFIETQKKGHIELAAHHDWSAAEARRWWTYLWPDLPDLTASTARRYMQQFRERKGWWAA